MVLLLNIILQPILNLLFMETYIILTGPAVIWKDGKLEYHINGKFVGVNLSNEEFKQKIKLFIFE
jgi:hypothetical protein